MISMTAEKNHLESEYAKCESELDVVLEMHDDSAAKVTILEEIIDDLQEQLYEKTLALENLEPAGDVAAQNQQVTEPMSPGKRSKAPREPREPRPGAKTEPEPRKDAILKRLEKSLETALNKVSNLEQANIQLESKALKAETELRSAKQAKSASTLLADQKVQFKKFGHKMEEYVRGNGSSTIIFYHHDL